MYDLIIVGGGPAGVGAGVYAGRKKIKTLLITDSFGGQSIVSLDIQNWIGEKSISGLDLAKKLEEHLKSQKNIDILEGDLVVEIKKNNSNFEVQTKGGKIFQAKYLLITAGSRRKKLNVPGEEKFNGRGVFYCAICDAPLMKNKPVAVIGGGNAGLEAVVDLFPHASFIHLLEFKDYISGDPLTLEKIKNQPKVQIITSAQTLEILGENFVTGLKYKDLISEEIKELKVEGVFVEIGSVPNSEIVKDLVELNNFGEIIINPLNQKTSCEGIWAAGDVTNFPYKQNNIAVGDAIVAVLNIWDTIRGQK